MLVISPAALDTQASWASTLEFVKFVALYYLISAVISTERAFDIFVAMHIAGAGWWGWEIYLDPSRQGGRLEEAGGYGINNAAAHLLTVVPFIVVYLTTSRDKSLRLLALCAAPFVAIQVLALVILAIFPELTTWLPSVIYGT